MANETPTTTLRLKEIIDAFSKITDSVERIVFRNSLTPQELADLDSYIKSLPKIAKPLPPKAPTDLLSDFELWSTGRIGLTQQELIQNYTDTHNLTDQSLKDLKDKITKKEATKEVAEKVTPPPVPPQVITRPAPELIIRRTPYPKWWNDEGIAKINLTSPGSQLVITARGDYSLYVAAIVLTVSDECDISFTFGSAGSSGPMNFGGDGEPKAIVIAMGNSPAPCGSGSFMVTASSTDPVNIGGFVSYFLWKKEP
jgi:hypothetical protein